MPVFALFRKLVVEPNMSMILDLINVYLAVYTDTLRPFGHALVL